MLKAALVANLTTIEAVHAATTEARLHPRTVEMALLDSFQVRLRGRRVSEGVTLFGSF